MEYWPIWALLSLVLCYELWAVISKHRTISQLIWKAQAQQKYYWLLPSVTALAMILLWAHFFLGLWK